MSPFLMPIFSILLLSMFIGTAMASLSKNPSKVYQKCQQLSESDDIKNMVEKLQDKFPLEMGNKANAVWNENGTVDYPNLFAAIKRFMSEIKENRKKLKKPTYIVVPAGERHYEPEYHYDYYAYDFDKTHRELKNILEEKCGKQKILLGVKRSVTVEQMLDETLECAISVGQFKEQSAGLGKLPKAEDWATLDGQFAAGLQNIWVPEEPAGTNSRDSLGLYKECHELSESSRFAQMIAQLQGQPIPIEKEQLLAMGNAKDPVNYPSLLSAIKGFMDEVEMHKKEIVPRTQLWTQKGYAVNPYAANFLYKTHGALVEILKKKCGTKLIDGLGNVNVTGEHALEQTLKCADEVHKFTQLILALEKGDNKKLPRKGEWTKLDGNFQAAVQKIWAPEAEKTVDNDAEENDDAKH